jgi:hypothetical protein
MSDLKVDSTQRVMMPPLAPFRGPLGAPRAILRPPSVPPGRSTLPPFGAIQRGGPLPGARPAPVPLPVPYAPPPIPTIEHDSWESLASYQAPAYQAPAYQAPAYQAPVIESNPVFEAAVRDLPVYVPDNVDVRRFTPQINPVVPPPAAELPLAEPMTAASDDDGWDNDDHVAAAEGDALNDTRDGGEFNTGEFDHRLAPLTSTPNAADALFSATDDELPTTPLPFTAPMLATPVRATPVRPTPVRSVTPVLPMAAIPDIDDDRASAPHRMTPMRVTPLRPTPVAPKAISSLPLSRTGTPILPMTPVGVEATAGIVGGSIPTDGNRRVAAALEEVAARVRRGALIVPGTLPDEDGRAERDDDALAAALAATLGALLGVTY